MSNILIGTTDRTVTVYIPDPASTDGSGKTGLTAADLTVSYTRVETDNDVVVTDVTSSLSTLSALTDAHTDWGVKEVSSTLAPGLYRLDIADAVFASGAWYAVVYVMITTSAAAATPSRFDLVAYNELDGVRLGLTALPNAAADAAGGLIISDAGGLDADAQRSDVAAILVDTAEIGAAGAGLTNINLPNQTMDITGNITGNLSGSVGSVTGNVGGNVAGSVASVTAAVTLTSGERTSVADALLNRDMSAVTVTNSRSPINALRILRNKVSVPLGIVYAEDDSTTAWEFTTTTDGAAEPITVVDPT